MAASASVIPFGRYRLIRKLAAGGMAEVYLAELATAAGLSKQLVIKIHRHLADDAEFRTMFIGEARIAVGLSHGNIAQVFDFGEVEGEYYLALEYVNGRTGSELVKRAQSLQMPLPLECCAFIALQMCQGLHYAHTRSDGQGRPLGLVHRDISPQNVIVSTEGEVKLVDFGIAKAYGEGSDPGVSETASGVVKGKYIYFSPEQAMGESLDALTDVYATGAVLYELVCGEAAYSGTMAGVLVKLMQKVPVDPARLRPDLPEALEGIILQAMAPAPADRFESALAMQEALAGFLAEYAPRLTSVALANLLRDLFSSNPQGGRGRAGTGPRPVSQVGPGPRPGASSGGRAAGGSTRAPPSPTGSVPAASTRAPPSPTGSVPAAEPRRASLLAAGVAMAVVLVVSAAVGIGFHMGTPEQVSTPLVVSSPVAKPLTLAAPTPSAAPVPPPPAAPAPAAEVALPDRLAALPVLSAAQNGGRLVLEMRCEGEPLRAEVQSLAKQAAEASADSHLNVAIALLNQAIGAEPTAGTLYVALADQASAAMNPGHTDLILRDLETFIAACPATRRPLLDSSYERLAEMADPTRPPPKRQDAYARVDSATSPEGSQPPAHVSAANRHKADGLRAEADALMRKGAYEQAEIKLEAALTLNPADRKLQRMMEACEATAVPDGDALRTGNGAKPGR